MYWEYRNYSLYNTYCGGVNMETKICNKCNIEKSVTEFRKYRNICKKCENLYNRNWYSKNKEYKRGYQKEYQLNNNEKIKETLKKWRENNKEYNKTYYINNRKRIIYKNIKYQEKRVKEDYIYKLKKQIRIMIYNSFYRNNFKKNNNIEKILGCNYETFIKYLLETFKNNYGYEWDGIEKVHIDHIIPLATAKTKEEVIKLCHYTNLQLLKAKDNIEKSDKLNWELKS